MITWKITYEDYDGVSHTEDFYFGLNKAELLELTFSKDGGYEKYLTRIINARDTKALFAEFKSIILASYGVKSDDGKRFIKNPELTEAFTQTEAYSSLFMELATDTDAMTRFVIGVLPADVREKAEEARKNGEFPQLNIAE